MKLFNITKNKVIIGNLKIAKSYRERTKGLLGRTSIDETEGMLIKNCNWIHMFFMKFPIDVIFLKKKRGTDAERNAELTRNKTIYKVVKITENIKPWRIGSPVFRADSVLEIKSETSKNIISVGDELKMMEEL
ncbi:MAG: DUF192 domain-containing protein [Elusimicrobiota bacterium]|nr:DUF192 domain-containing protein [Elusimicrobiota bacterium]